ncbi:MAG TPA: DUF3168 domain-containing protein [bacterium]|nr:DUF3168 domain-containing protein [bacterium]
MNIPGPLRAIIAANGTANGLLSGRIYPKVAPKGYTLPLAVINVISTNPANTKTGVSDADIALVQIDAYGETYASAAAVSEAIRQAIDHYRGDVVAGSNTYGIDLIEFSGAQDEYEEDAKVYRFLCEYTLRYMRNGITGVVSGALGLQSYNSDAEAVADGLAIGDFYVTGSLHETLPAGVLKQVTA